LDEIGLLVNEEMSFKIKSLLMDGCRTKSDHKSSPCHFVTGELKIFTRVVKKGQESILQKQTSVPSEIIINLAHSR
jgi:hypothetical protein